MEYRIKLIGFFIAFPLVLIFWFKGEIPTWIFIIGSVGLFIGIIPKEGFKAPDED